MRRLVVRQFAFRPTPKEKRRPLNEEPWAEPLNEEPSRNFSAGTLLTNTQPTGREEF